MSIITILFVKHSIVLIGWLIIIIISLFNGNNKLIVFHSNNIYHNIVVFVISFDLFLLKNKNKNANNRTHTQR